MQCTECTSQKLHVFEFDWVLCYVYSTSEKCVRPSTENDVWDSVAIQCYFKTSSSSTSFHQSFQSFFFLSISSQMQKLLVLYILCVCLSSCSSTIHLKFIQFAYFHLFICIATFFFSCRVTACIRLAWLGLDWRCALLTSRKVKDDDFGSQR